MIKSSRKTGAQNRSTYPSEIIQHDQKPQKNRSIGAEIPSCNRKMKHIEGGTDYSLGWCGHGKVNRGSLFNFQRWIHSKGKHFSSYMWVLNINRFIWDRGKKLEEVKSTNNSPFQCLSSDLNDPIWPNHTGLHCSSLCTLSINTE